MVLFHVEDTCKTLPLPLQLDPSVGWSFPQIPLNGTGLFQRTRSKKGRLFLFAQCFVLIPTQQQPHLPFFILLQE